MSNFKALCRSRDMSRVLLALLLLGGGVLVCVRACSEAVCASIGSKCMLTDSCNCDINDKANHTCYQRCSLCLGTLFEECCYCFKMCPKPEHSWLVLSHHSEVEEISEPMPELFDALTEVEDQHRRWVSYSFPVDRHIGVSAHLTSPPKFKVKLVPLDSDGNEVVVARGGAARDTSVVTLNCTVAYMSECRSWRKCLSACRSMGASSVRWFQNGCCQCVGETCLNFGINESRCELCNEANEALVEQTVSDEQLDEKLATSPNLPLLSLKPAN